MYIQRVLESLVLNSIRLLFCLKFASHLIGISQANDIWVCYAKIYIDYCIWLTMQFSKCINYVKNDAIPQTHPSNNKSYCIITMLCEVLAQYHAINGMLMHVRWITYLWCFAISLKLCTITWRKYNLSLQMHILWILTNLLR